MATRFKIWTICLCTICTGATQAVEPGNSTWKLDNWSPSLSKSIKPNFSLTTTTQVELSHRLDFHWYLARVRGETGLVPAAYLEIIARCTIPLHPEKPVPNTLTDLSSPNNGALREIPATLRRQPSPLGGETLSPAGDEASSLVARGHRLLSSLNPRDAEAQELFV